MLLPWTILPRTTNADIQDSPGNRRKREKVFYNDDPYVSYRILFGISQRTTSGDYNYNCTY